MFQMQRKQDQRLWESQTSSLESVFRHPGLVTVAGFVPAVFSPSPDKNEIYSDHVSLVVSVRIAVLTAFTEGRTLCRDTAGSNSLTSSTQTGFVRALCPSPRLHAPMHL